MTWSNSNVCITKNVDKKGAALMVKKKNLNKPPKSKDTFTVVVKR